MTRAEATMNDTNHGGSTRREVMTQGLAVGIAIGLSAPAWAETTLTDKETRIMSTNRRDRSTMTGMAMTGAR